MAKNITASAGGTTVSGNSLKYVVSNLGSNIKSVTYNGTEYWKANDTVENGVLNSTYSTRAIGGHMNGWQSAPEFAGSGTTYGGNGGLWCQCYEYNRCIAVQFDNPINCTGVSKITIRYGTKTIGGNVYAKNWLILSPTSNGSISFDNGTVTGSVDRYADVYNPNANSYHDVFGTYAEQTLTWDVSGLSGNHYLIAACSSSNAYKVAYINIVDVQTD